MKTVSTEIVKFVNEETSVTKLVQSSHDELYKSNDYQLNNNKRH